MYFTEQLLGHVAHNNSELRSIISLMKQVDDDNVPKVMLVSRIDQLITDNESIIAEILECDDTIDADDFKKSIAYLLNKTTE